MTEKRVTQNDLAEATNMAISTVNRKLKTGDDFTVGEMRTITSYLELTSQEVIEIFLN